MTCGLVDSQAFMKKARRQRCLVTQIKFMGSRRRGGRLILSRMLKVFLAATPAKYEAEGMAYGT